MDRILNRLDEDNFYEMANLSPKRTGLKVTVWSDHEGVLGNYEHDEPRVKIGKRGQFEVSVSLKDFRFLAQTTNIKQSEKKAIEEAIEYVKKNVDVFLKHFNDTDDSFDDTDLIEELKKRGFYK